MTLVGEEAHIVARSPGGPRYRRMDAKTCDGYVNRILLCPTHHAEVDAQPQTWSEERLLKRKREHELLMGSRTSHGQPHGLVFERRPDNVGLPLLLSGAQVLAVTGGALAYDRGKEELGTEAERDRAAALLQCAQDWGRSTATSVPLGISKSGTSMSCFVSPWTRACFCTVPSWRQRSAWATIGCAWPVGYLRLRRAESAAAELRARPDDTVSASASPATRGWACPRARPGARRRRS